MKTEKNILIAFLLNLGFSIIEFVGGLITNSIAIISDSIHDFGDSISIGISYFLEKKSKKKADKEYTYGYVRYSVLGSVITTVILLTGSLLVIYNSVLRILNPININYSKMIYFAIFGTIINLLAMYFTREGDSMNQKSVNLHMLEDVLGWIIVLIGAIIMKFTNISILDPILSILVAIYIFIHASKNLKVVLDLFLEKTPSSINIDELKRHILDIKGIEDVHHIHVWSMDGFNNYATMHIVTKDDKVKHLVREELEEHGICHVIIETDRNIKDCDDLVCNPNLETHHHHHHH